MSETLDTNGGAPQGKGQALTGFILALVALVLAPIIAGIAATMIVTGGSGWLMYVWDVLAVVSIILSGMGMSKLGKTGGKKGLGIAGLIIGIVALVWCIMLTLGLSVADAGMDAAGGDLQELRNELDNM
ncbi:MAG: hypothetical protein QE487_13575 [Fluviicola sp.]|nr:hypothetical protein [Fluviicola sp.]